LHFRAGLAIEAQGGIGSGNQVAIVGAEEVSLIQKGGPEHLIQCQGGTTTQELGWRGQSAEIIVDQYLSEGAITRFALAEPAQGGLTEPPIVA